LIVDEEEGEDNGEVRQQQRSRSFTATTKQVEQRRDRERRSRAATALPPRAAGAPADGTISQEQEHTVEEDRQPDDDVGQPPLEPVAHQSPSEEEVECEAEKAMDQQVSL
jgi:hypothetical protein